MVKKIFSMKMAVLVMIIFALAIGVATFIENDYGTQSARALIYNAKWFEVLLFYFIAIVIYNIFVFKMYKKEKWGQLVLHLAFIFIAIGAFLTRYVGYEGILHLRNGQINDLMVSDYMNLSLKVKDDNKTYYFDKKLTLSSMTKNSFNTNVKIGNKDLNIKLLSYMPSAKKVIKQVNSGGSEYLEFMVSPANSMAQTIYLKRGDSIDFGAFELSYDAKKETFKPVVKVYKDSNGTLKFISPFDVFTKSMKTMQNRDLKSGEYELKYKTLYNIRGNSFVLKKEYKNALVTYENSSLKSGGKYPQMIKLKLSSGKESKIVTLFGRDGTVGEDKKVSINGMELALSYGAKIIKLPFSIKLDRFQLDRYPGSMQPSSYSSYIRVIDKEKNRNFKYHIYMNHVLDYRGYRFFQSSYDMDEQGSILSVNHDPGTLITYIGYLMLIIGFIWSYFSKKSRVQVLLKKLNKLKSTASIVVTVGLFLSLNGSLNAAKIDASNLTPQELKTIQSISKEHSEKFARLIVQNFNGRMEPMDTLAKNVIQKISGKKGFLNLDYNQIFIGIIVEPEIYHKLRFIKISHPLLAKKLGLKKDSKFVAVNDFFTNGGKGDYKIKADLDEARKTKPALRSKYQKELIKVDERLNIVYMADQGYLLKLFPKANDKNNKWYDPVEALKSFSPKEGQIVNYIVSSYINSVIEGIKTGNWKKANEATDVIRNFQKFYGSDIIPSKNKVEAEIFYNRIDIFPKLSLSYVLIGLGLLILAFISIINSRLKFKFLTRILLFLLIVTLTIHTLGLFLRWYIAGHAPWSNAYESILYIAWATALAGFVFAKKSPLSFAATSILAGIFLLVAFLSSLDPQITNLVPVLKSYWLMIHVAVITASYGFLGLGALLGMLVLILFIVNGIKENSNIKNAIKELTIINEITLFIGLALITVGNFLGGVWANESWGRYWSWDPKETWAAVTILVYAAVVHIRFIPKFNSIFAFNVAALLAYSSVIMTYFGVNYYLSGMHSYAAGDPVPIPVWVYPAIVSIFALIFVSFLYKNKNGANGRL